MTEPQWRYHTPERDGHAPDDWVEGMETEFQSETPGVWNIARVPTWSSCFQYRYRPLQDATVEPTLETLIDQCRSLLRKCEDASAEADKQTLEALTAQCLRLPQDQREALIEAMQKPQRDWADEVAVAANVKALGFAKDAHEITQVAAVIRSMCRPKEGGA